MEKRISPAVVLATLVLVVVTGCSSDNDGSTSSAPKDTTRSVTPTTTTISPTRDEETVLRSAVTKYSGAFLTGDSPIAYGLLSARCKKRMSAAEFSDIVAGAKDMYGSALPIKTFHAQISGDLARVTYTYDVSAINQDSEPWVREGGHWHEDDC